LSGYCNLEFMLVVDRLWLKILVDLVAEGVCSAACRLSKVFASGSIEDLAGRVDDRSYAVSVETVTDGLSEVASLGADAGYK